MVVTAVALGVGRVPTAHSSESKSALRSAGDGDLPRHDWTGARSGERGPDTAELNKCHHVAARLGVRVCGIGTCADGAVSELPQIYEHRLCTHGRKQSVEFDCLACVRTRRRQDEPTREPAVACGDDAARAGGQAIVGEDGQADGISTRRRERVRDGRRGPRMSRSRRGRRTGRRSASVGPSSWPDHTRRRASRAQAGEAARPRPADGTGCR